MKQILFCIITLFACKNYAQVDKTIEWINHNSIEIEDADPNSELTAFSKKTPERFKNARIYGFGELSHDGKEYFDIKAKYFKYLVKNEGVLTFMMEEGYQAESPVNQWITGQDNDILSMGTPFQVGFWYSEEIYDLLRWMRIYNLDRSKEEQIKFYGIDVKSGKNFNVEVHNLIDKYKIPISKDLLVTLDDCSNKSIDYYAGTKEWADKQVPKLIKLQNEINRYQIANDLNNSKDFNSIDRSISNLINYTEYVQDPKSEVRDNKMFENSKWIIDKESKNGKAFLWAHNEHINKRGMWSSNSGIVNLGKQLKDYYGDDYYCVGFDFGIGTLKGFENNKRQQGKWRLYQVDKPYKKTYSHTLFKANYDIFFIDMSKAIDCDETKFFSTSNFNLSIGSGGFSPKPLYKIKMRKIYADEYDGLIFIKEISPANNNIKVN